MMKKSVGSNRIGIQGTDEDRINIRMDGKRSIHYSRTGTRKEGHKERPMQPYSYLTEEGIRQPQRQATSQL